MAKLTWREKLVNNIDFMLKRPGERPDGTYVDSEGVRTVQGETHSLVALEKTITWMGEDDDGRPEEKVGYKTLVVRAEEISKPEYAGLRITGTECETVRDGKWIQHDGTGSFTNWEVPYEGPGTVK